MSSNSKLFAGIFSFLEQIYASVAETLPDVRDNTYENEVDPYALEVETVVEQKDVGESDSQRKMRLASPKTKVKKFRRGVAVDPSRTVQAGCEVRWLPPGNMKDYWTQYKQQVGDKSTGASFPTFWRVAWLLPFVVQ